MNITDLKAAVDRAIAQGIHPDTVVVIDADHMCEGDWLILDRISDPSNPDDSQHGFIWFTLHPSRDVADGRFTPGHDWPD